MIHTCTECKRSFPRRTDLSRHMDIHDESTASRFSCPYQGCSVTARQAANIKSHVKAVHEHVKFNCPHCPQQCASLSSLIRHKQRKHGYSRKSRATKSRRSCSSESECSTSTPPVSPEFIPKVEQYNMDKYFSELPTNSVEYKSLAPGYEWSIPQYSEDPLAPILGFSVPSFDELLRAVSPSQFDFELRLSNNTPSPPPSPMYYEPVPSSPSSPFMPSPSSAVFDFGSLNFS